MSSKPSTKKPQQTSSKKNNSNAESSKGGQKKPQKSTAALDSDDELLSQLELKATAARAELAEKAERQASEAEARLVASAKAFMPPAGASEESLDISTLVPELAAMNLANAENSCWLAYVFHYLVSLHVALGYRVMVRASPVVRFYIVVYKESAEDEHIWNVLETADGQRAVVDLSIRQYGASIFAGQELVMLADGGGAVDADTEVRGRLPASLTILTSAQLPDVELYARLLTPNCLVDTPDVTITSRKEKAEEAAAAFVAWGQRVKRINSFRNKNNLPNEIKDLVLASRMKGEPVDHALARAASNIGRLGDLLKQLVPRDVMEWVDKLPLSRSGLVN